MRGGAVAVRTGGGAGFRQIGAFGCRHRGVTIGLEGSGVGNVIDQDTGAAGINGVKVEVGPVTGLPIDNPERIQTGLRRIHGPNGLVLLITGESLNLHTALIRSHRWAEEIARIRGHIDLKVVVVIHVGAVRARTDAKGGDSGGKFEEADRLHREIIGAAAGSRNAGKGIRGESDEEVAIRIEQIKSGGILLEIHRVHGVTAIGVAPGDGLIRDGRAKAVGQRAVNLLEGADQVVGNGGVLRGLDRADDEAPGRRTAQRQRGGDGERVGGRVHRSESGAGQQGDGRQCSWFHDWFVRVEKNHGLE